MINTVNISSTKRVIPLIFLFISLIALFLGIKPKIQGDGIEYLLMQESMFSHGNLILSENVSSLTSLLEEERAERVTIWYKHTLPHIEKKMRSAGGYVRCKDGQYRSYHFWFYSFCSLPFRTICNLLSIEPTYSFSMLNLAMIIWLIYATYRNQFLAYKERVILSFIWVYTFAVFYFDWIHPEVFSATLLSISILHFIDKRTSSAILLASVSALQNQPIALILPVLYIAQSCSFFRKKSFLLCLFPFEKKADWARVFLAAIIVLLPSVYYSTVFGHPNPISAVGGVASQLISIQRFTSLWLDLNQGVILGFSGAIFILIIGIIHALKSASRSQLLNQRTTTIISGMIIISIPCLMQGNWNAGSAYMLRYGLWIGCPLIIASVIVFRGLTKKIQKPILLFALFLHSSSSWLAGIPAETPYLRFNAISKKILKWAPAMYNPDPEIFAERLLGKEEVLNKKDIFILYEGEKISKILARNVPCKKNSFWIGQHVYQPSEKANFSHVVTKKNWVYLNGKSTKTEIQTFDITFDDDSCEWENWSYTEEGFRWSLGKESTLTFSFSNNVKKAFGLFKLAIQPQGAGQQVQVCLNEHLIYDGFLDERKTLLLTTNTKNLNLNGENKLKFNIPNAQKPFNSLDPRILGIKFFSLSFLISE